MKKFIKISVAIVVVLIITIVIVVNFIDVNQYKGDIISLVEKNTGRDFAIDGDFKFALSLIPTVQVEGITFGNAAWGSEKNMVKVGRLEIQVSLLPLISGNIHVNRLILVSPEILLETNNQGTGNWVLKPGQTGTATTENKQENGPGKLPNFSVDVIEITDARVTYRNGQTGKQTNLTIPDITVDGGGLGDPVALTMNAAYNAVPVKLKGKIGAPDLLINNQNYPVQFTAYINQATVKVDGVIAKPLQAKGLNLALAFHADELQTLSAIAKSELPKIGPVDFAGTLTDNESGYVLKSVSIKLDKSDLTGTLSASLSGKKPAVSADFSSDLLDIASLSGAEGAKQKKTEKSPDAKIFPATPLPLESLHTADANIRLHVKKIHSSAADLEDMNLGLRLQNGKLEIKPLTARLAGGTLQTAIILDGSNKKSASLNLNVDIRNLQPGLLPDLRGKITDAATNIKINAGGTGNSIAGIMADLNGRILIQSGKGVYKSNNKGSGGNGLLSKTYGMLNPEANADKGTNIECLVVNLNVKDGRSSFDRKIALATDKIDVLGSGTLNFKTEQLDIGAVPQAREGIGLSGKSLAELVRLRGTFANPKVAPDTKAALKAGLSAGAAVATGGLSLLAQGLLGESKAVSDPCALALGKKPEQKTQPQQQTEPTTNNPLDSVKSKLKSLFGG